MKNRHLEYVNTIMANAISGSRREKNVMMFHVGRSGSTVLGDLFNQNQDIFWDSEIFMPNRMPAISKSFRRLIYSHPAVVVRIRRMRTKKPIYGAEVKLAHVARIGMKLPQFITTMKNLDFSHFIVLRRRNHLRVIISHLVANQQGHWHQTVQGAPAIPPPIRVAVNVDSITIGSNPTRKRLSLIEHLQATEEDFNQLNLLLEGQSVLNLVYEDHIQKDPSDAYRRVCNFLDITPLDVQIHLRRTNPLPTKDLVSNYEEVASTLAGSSYEWMLNE